jgi:hypothetical protein
MSAWVRGLLEHSQIELRYASRAARPADFYILRPILFASMLILFIAFDDRDTQFIYFQF